MLFFKLEFHSNIVNNTSGKPSQKNPSTLLSACVAWHRIHFHINELVSPVLCVMGLTAHLAKTSISFLSLGSCMIKKHLPSCLSVFLSFILVICLSFFPPQHCCHRNMITKRHHQLSQRTL